MSSDVKLKKIRGIRSKISQRSWRIPGKLQAHSFTLRKECPMEVRVQFKEACRQNQESMRDATIKLLRFYIWNEGVPKLPPMPRYKVWTHLMVMCIPRTTAISFKAQCINQQQSMDDAVTALLRYYVHNKGVPDGPPEPKRYTRNDDKRYERRRTFEFARKHNTYTAWKSLDRRLDTD